jgi:hypothetical protein
MSYFEIILDTVGPEITINVPPYVLSSAELDVVIQGDESLESSFQEFVLIDSLGEQHPFILTHYDTYFKGKISLNDIPLGIATIQAQVQDTVLNLSPVVSKSVHITKGARVKIFSTISSRNITVAQTQKKVITKMETRPVKAVID